LPPCVVDLPSPDDTTRSLYFTGPDKNLANTGFENDTRIESLEAHSRELDEKIRKLEAAQKKSVAQESKLPTIAVNGAFQVDGVAFRQGDASRFVYGDIDGGADFRRARLSAKGAVSDRMDYFMQMDFGFFGRPTFTDLWVDFKDAGPLGTIRVGQWKQPFSLEVASSYRYTTFMERAGTFQAFTPFRHIGVGFYDHSDDLNWTWAASYLRTGQDQYGGSLSTDGGNGIAGRLTHLLWYNGPSGEDYLHVGGGYFLNAPPNERYRYRSIPELFVGEFSLPAGQPIGTSGQAINDVANGTPFFVDTGSLSGTSLTQTFGTEALLVRGPLSLQSEIMGSMVDTSTVGDGFLWGSYSQVGYFLTGEYRPYDRKAGAIDRVMPFDSLTSAGGGFGAWEVAARWSYLDLTDREIRGGSMENLTFGLNWYVNPYCKCVFNYIHSWSESRQIRNGSIMGGTLIASQTDAFGMRCQVDF
jgi:phosphate-selective porin OprO/OprP